MMTRSVLPILLLLLTACSEGPQEGADERRTAVTTASVVLQEVERGELSVGRLRANDAPAISAETTGQVALVRVDAGDRVEVGDVLAGINPEVQQLAVNSARAELRRLEALLDNERRRVRRLGDLAERRSIPQDQLDEAVTNVEALEAQIEAAQSRLQDAEYNLRQTTIVSPVSGRVQARLVSAGDYVSPGMRVFELVSGDALRAFLPLPEHLQDRVGIGQSVRLTIPARPDSPVMAEVSELRPVVGEASRAVELIVEIDNPGDWRPGGSVTGEIIIERHQGLVVPPASVVQRPGGAVVYVVEGDRVQERAVTVGLRDSNWVEIVEGLEEGDEVVVDGAGFLTDGAPVDIQPREARS